MLLRAKSARFKLVANGRHAALVKLAEETTVIAFVAIGVFAVIAC